MLTERTINIIKLLISANNGITLEALANEFKISVRTLRNEIHSANDFLVKKRSGYIKNIKKIGVVLALNVSQKDKLLSTLEQIRQTLFLQPESRSFDLLLDIAFNLSPTYLYHKEQQYQVSKSTLDDDIKRVRHLLNNYQIEVISIAKQGLLFNGPERSIRTMLFDLINTNVGILNYQNQGIDESIHEKILFTYIDKDIFQKIDFAYDYAISAQHDNYYRKYFLIFTAIWLKRSATHGIYTRFASERTVSKASGITVYIDKIIELFNISVPDSEINYLLSILQTLNPKTMSNSLEGIQAQLLTIQLIQFVEKDTHIPFSKREDELYEGLYCHILGLLNRMKNNLQVLNPLNDSIKSNHQQLYQSVKKFTPVIEKMVKKKIISDEITFLTIYFSTSEYKIKQNISHIYKAAVICNHGSATARLLAENLKALFNIDVVAMLSSRELDILGRLDVDILFSTIKIELSNKPHLLLQPIIRDIDRQNIEIFLAENSHLQRKVNTYSQHTNLFLALLNTIERATGNVSKEIYQEVVQILETHGLNINKEEIQPMLKEILKETDILFNLSVTNWQDSIEKVSVPLIASQVIEPCYVDSMIEAVKKHGPYIVIDKHIALAHARPEDGVNKLGISVARLSTPICFGHNDNDPVTVLFCLAAIDSYSHLNIMKNIVELINDKERLNQLLAADNKQHFQNILYS